MHEAGSQNAVAAIRSDLSLLRHRRRIAFCAYIGLVSALLLVLYLSPGPSKGVPQDSFWLLSLALLFAISVVAGAVTIGVPLVSRRAAWVIGGVLGLGLVGALSLVARWSAPSVSPLAAGTSCFLYCTGISALTMVLLGMVSGRLWRRFPNPGILVAVGATGVGLAALHMHCGAADPLHLFGFHLTPVVLLYGVARLMTRGQAMHAERSSAE